MDSTSSKPKTLTSAIVATPPAKVTKLKKKTLAAVPLKKAVVKLARKPAAASEKKGPTRSITVSHEKSRSRFCVRLFTDGKPVATSFSYKFEAKVDVEKKMKVHLLEEKRRYGVTIQS